MRGIISEIKGRVAEYKNIQRHRKEVERIAHELGYSFPFHDLIKSWNVLLLGDEVATKLHRRFSNHHLRHGDIKNKVEAAVDWESARFTKPTKPLNAYQTWQKYYSQVDMLPSLRMLGLDK